MRYQVQDDKRHTKRKMLDALDNDLVKILTELITNSDDSYRRLCKDAGKNLYEKDLAPISIIVDSIAREVTVIDNAEGMSKDVIIENFESYGADTSGRAKGHETRGLFGQGASDVLFTQKDSKLLTIKDSNFNEASFGWEDERFFDIEEKPSISISEFKSKYGIKKNGTVINFTLSDKVPMPRDFVERLRVFYMLRFLFNDPYRKIDVRFKKKGRKHQKAILSYQFPKVDKKEILCDEDISFKFEKWEVTGRLKLYHSEHKKKIQETHGELRVLVYDNENNIYDNTFFDYSDTHPGIEYLHGELKLFGTADIIREKLNDKHPEEILSDKRDGLSKKHPFYRKLNKAVDPIISKIVKNVSKQSKDSLSSDKFADHERMFKDLNKYLSENLDQLQTIGAGQTGLEPPADGLDFPRERIKITKGKRYSLRLIVNTEIIKPGTTITIKASDSKHVEVNIKKIKVSSKDVKENNIAIYNMYITGKEVTSKDCIITAGCTSAKVEKEIFVAVIDQDIHYPAYGLEFFPSKFRIKPNKKAKLNLYIDTDKFKVGSKINLVSTEAGIKIDYTSISLSKNHLIFENIAVVPIYITGDLGKRGKILASCNSYTAEAEVLVVDRDEEPIAKSGIITGWTTDNRPDQHWQKFKHPITGKIVINEGHHINKYYFGDELTEDKVKTNIICQKYLAELMTEEVAKFIIQEKIENQHVKNEYEAAIEEHQKEKNKVAAIIYTIVKKNKL